ncbi:hypothetical protein R6Z07M_015084 [Ovis aries]
MPGRAASGPAPPSTPARKAFHAGCYGKDPCAFKRPTRAPDWPRRASDVTPGPAPRRPCRPAPSPSRPAARSRTVGARAGPGWRPV